MARGADRSGGERRRECLAGAVIELPEEDRLVIELRSRRGLGFKEVAEEASLPDADAARHVYRRAIRALGRLLARGDP